MNRFDAQNVQQTADTQNRFNVGGFATAPAESPLAADQPIGFALNFVGGLPDAAMQVGGAILGFLKDVGQGIVRSAIGAVDTVALDATRVPVLNRILPPASTFEKVPIPKFLQWATGTDNVYNLGTQALDAAAAIKNSSWAQQHGFDQYAMPLAVAGISIDTGLNLTPFGGEDAVAKRLVKETTDLGVEKILLKIGTDAELAKVFAPKFAATMDLQGVKDGLNILKGAQGLKAGDFLAQQAATKAPEAVAPVTSAIEKATSPELQGLADVISKSNTFEDFKATLVDNPRLTSLFDTYFKSDAELKAFFEESKPYLSTIEKTGTEALPHTTAPLNQAADTLLNLSAEEKASFKPIIADVAKTVKNKVHIMDYFQTPEFVLEKIGLAKEAAGLQVAKDAYQAELKTQIAKVTSWFNEVKDIPGAAQNIFKFLDGQTVQLSGIEEKVAGEIKTYLASWADRLGLPEDKRIANYITHLFEPDFIKKEFDPEMAKIITDKIAGSVYDPFLEKRLGKMGFREDVFAALDAYVKRATRKVNFDPALSAIKEASKTLDVESAKYIQRLTSRINLRPTEVDTLIDNLFKSVFGYKAGVRPVARITQQIRQWIYRGTLGLNLGSALRNLTQGVNTYAKLGEKYTIVGYSKLFSRLVTRNLGELFENGVLNDALVQDRRLGVYKSILQKLDGTLFKFFDISEKINRGAAYFGAKSKAIAAGASEADAIKFAKRIVRETQFAFGNVDSPVIMSSDLAKVGFQLQTYNIKQLEMLKNMIKNKEFAGLIRFSAASIAAVATIGQLFGMKLGQQLVPTVKIGGSPFGNFLGGLSDLLTGTEQQKTAAKQKFGATLSAFVPAGSQIRKTIQGIEAYNAGKDVTKTGRLRYNIEQTPFNAIRAAFFGKSTLPAAQDYFNSIGKKKTPAAPAGNRFSK